MGQIAVELTEAENKILDEIAGQEVRTDEQQALWFLRKALGETRQALTAERRAKNKQDKARIEEATEELSARIAELEDQHTRDQESIDSLREQIRKQAKAVERQAERHQQRLLDYRHEFLQELDQRAEFVRSAERQRIKQILIDNIEVPHVTQITTQLLHRIYAEMGPIIPAVEVDPEGLDKKPERGTIEPVTE